MKITILPLLIHFAVFISVFQCQPVAIARQKHGRTDALNILRQIRRKITKIQQSLTDVISLEKQLIMEGEPSLHPGEADENLIKTNTNTKQRKSNKHLPFNQWAGR